MEAVQVQSGQAEQKQFKKIEMNSLVVAIHENKRNAAGNGEKIVNLFQSKLTWGVSWKAFKDNTMFGLYTTLHVLL